VKELLEVGSYFSVTPTSLNQALVVCYLFLFVYLQIVAEQHSVCSLDWSRKCLFGSFICVMYHAMDAMLLIATLKGNFEII